MKSVPLILLAFCLVVLNTLISSAGEGDRAGFKGIYLGQSRADFLSYINSDANWKNKHEYPLDESANIFDLRTKYEIGRQGEGADSVPYLIGEVKVRWRHDQVSEIIIYSPRVRADLFDIEVKRWAMFARAGLNKKYGKPKNILEISRLGILNIKSGYDRILSVWDNKNERIRLMAGSEDFEYYSVIQFEDKQAAAEKKVSRENITSEF